jgi:hypothetical protein
MTGSGIPDDTQLAGVREQDVVRYVGDGKRRKLFEVAVQMGPVWRVRKQVRCPFSIFVHPISSFRDGFMHYSAQLTADASVRTINSNLEEKLEGETSLIVTINFSRAVAVEGRQHRTSFDDSDCQSSGVQPCFRDEICWPPQPWAQQ